MLSFIFAPTELCWVKRTVIIFRWALLGATTKSVVCYAWSNMANERTRHQIKGLIFKHRRSVLEETNEENTLLANIFKKKTYMLRGLLLSQPLIHNSKCLCILR